MSDPCPDNSTECLLRAILDADSGYDWNPITFSFTAVFTIIAVIVSIFALVQGFVAAGPGRLKASDRAIGRRQHDLRADTRFSWKEFRFRTLVNVPVIDTRRILENGPSVISIASIQEPKTQVIRIQDRSVAGWSQLLDDLSLNDIDFNTIECLTDYLPDDILAAPAWARMETIVLLCIMKGCTRLVVNEDGYISASGPSAQLSWNMHQSLGPIAIYRTWDTLETSMHKLDDVQKMIPVCLGTICLANEKLFGLGLKRRGDLPVTFDFSRLSSFMIDCLKQCRHDHDHCANRKRGLWAGYLTHQGWEGGVNKEAAALASALLADRPARVKAFPSRATRMHWALKTVYEEYFPWLMLADDLDDQVLSTLCGSAFVEFDGREAVTDATTVEYPKKTSWLVPASRKPLSEHETLRYMDRPRLYQPDSRLGAVINKSTALLVTDEKIMSADLRISRTAVRCVSRWLADDTYFETSNSIEIAKAKMWLVYQLGELDWFLSSIGKDAICAAANLIALGSSKFGVKFTKVSRRFVMPETLDAFNLTWTIDPNDNGSIIIQGYLDRETIQRLFKYTKNYVEVHRSELHTVKCAKASQGFYFATKKHHFKPSSLTKQGTVISGSDALLTTSTTNSTDSSATEKAVDWDAKDIGDSTYEEISNMSRSEITDTNGTVKSPTHVKSAQELGDPELRRLISEGRPIIAGDDEVAVHVDRKVSALEAMTFFRAAVYATLLATGTDTTPVVSSEKRYELVQVQ